MSYRDKNRNFDVRENLVSIIGIIGGFFGMLVSFFLPTETYGLVNLLIFLMGLGVVILSILLIFTIKKYKEDSKEFEDFI